MDDKELCKELRSAIKNGDTDKVESILRSNKHLLNVQTPFGTWLHVAASHGKLKTVNRLLALGADVNEKGGIAGANALHSAASNGHIDVVSCLLHAGTEIDVSEPERNPLFGAIYGGHTAIAKILIENGIDTGVRYTGENMKEMDAVAYAKEWGRSDIVNLLSK